MSGPATFFARAEWRAHWRAHLGLAAVVAIAVAAVLATLTAASRSERAFARLRTATAAGDVGVYADDLEVLESLRTQLRAIDGITAVAEEGQPFIRPAGRDGLYPDYNLIARGSREAHGARVNDPVVVSGRALDPSRPDEILLSEKLAADLRVSVGDRLMLESATDAWVDVANEGGDPGPPDGPRIRATVVGVARSPADFSRWVGVVHVTPAFLEEYEDQMRTATRVEVRISGDGAVSRGTRERVVAAGGENSRPSFFADSGATDDGLATIARALRIVAAVAAVAGFVVIVLAVSRLARSTFREHATLRALGWTRAQFSWAALATFGPAMLLGVVIGVAAGTVLAPRALVGLAGRVDPEPHSVLPDWRAIAVVGISAAVLGVAVAAVSGRWSVQREERRTRPTPRLLRLDRPVPVVLGARRALTGESELGGRTSRGAAIVLAVAVAGALAALVVAASIERLQTDPILSGQGSREGRSVDSGESLDVYREAFPALEADPRVAALNGIHVAFGASSGEDEITLLVFDHVRGSLGASMVAGRLPRGRDEIALGPATAERLGKRIGDRVRLQVDGVRASYRLAGEVLFPEGDFDPSDAGAVLTMRAAQRLLGDVEERAEVHTIEFEWADGVDVRRADAELLAAGFTVFSAEDVPLFPPRVTNLGEVEEVPRYLAVFLGVLALVTLGHALATSVRRRARETATLRALGLTRKGSAAIVAIQSTTIVLAALLVGVPLGLLVGDRIWTLIAQGAHVVVLTVAPPGALTGFVVAVVVLAALATVGPARRTARLRPGEALRAE